MVALHKDDVVRRMSEVLKAGGKMLSQTCPVCGNPLFEIKGEMRCVVCDKPVVVIRDQVESGKALLPIVLTSLEGVVVEKIDELTGRLAGTVDLDEIEETARAIDSLLTVLKKSEEIRIATKQTE
ncbi:MAG: Sjogren's syndrome/scleroderma autoantigen 1 family protein [Nitrososphaerota archaeon]